MGVRYFAGLSWIPRRGLRPYAGVVWRAGRKHASSIGGVIAFVILLALLLAALL
jgi:hypothetical protein